jgi:hypothetical protein
VSRHSPLRVVQAIYRLTKACALHSDANQTVRSLIAPALEAVRAFCDERGADAAIILFSGDMVFVNRRLLRAPREVYALALQLGGWLEACNATELTLPRSVSESAMLALARALTDAQRERDRKPDGERFELGGISLRNAPPFDAEGGQQVESIFVRVVKTYATAAILVDGMHAAIDAGQRPNPQDLKRIAQKLVAVAEDHVTLLVALAAAPIDERSRGRRALSTAVIALSMGRRLTDDRALLAALVQAALLDAPDTAPSPGELTARVRLLAELGGFGPPALRRAVIDLESRFGLALQRTSSLASVLACARSFNALRARGSPLDAALAAVEAGQGDAGAEPCVRLLAPVLGVLAPGTAVELSSGEVAIVTARARRHLDVLRPPVLVLTDAHGESLPSPIEVDLAKPSGTTPVRWVKHAAARARSGLGT